MTYQVQHDGPFTRIKVVHAPVEPDCGRFATYSEAKQDALKSMRSIRDMYNDAIYNMSHRTKTEVLAYGAN